MRPLRNGNRTQNSLRTPAPHLFAFVYAGALLLVSACAGTPQSAAQSGVVVLPPGTSQNKPDWSALLIYPLEQMRADPHWRVYAAVVTRDHKTLQALLNAGDSPDGFGNFMGYPLVVACQIDDLESVSALLKSGANVNLFWRGSTSPLIMAAEWGHPDIVRYLLAHGALPNEATKPGGRSALFTALNHRDFAILTLLIESGADVNLPANDGTTLLMTAALNNDFQLVNFLQDHGAKFNSPDEELFYFAASGDVPGIQRVLTAGAHVNRPFGSEYVTPLMAAAVNGQTRAVKFLIAHRANINAYDEVHDTPLMYAIKSRHNSTVLALLDAGANPMLDNVAQVTTLHQSAIYMDDPEIVHRLIARGVPPAAGDSISVTPLMYAAEFGHYETVKILLDAHVAVNVQSREGRTALIGAATSGQADIVNLLLRAGADPSIRDKQNRTALDYARQMHQERVISIIEKNLPESLTSPSNPPK